MGLWAMRTPNQQSMDLYGDNAAVLNSLVSNSYYAPGAHSMYLTL